MAGQKGNHMARSPKSVGHRYAVYAAKMNTGTDYASPAFLLARDEHLRAFAQEAAYSETYTIKAKMVMDAAAVTTALYPMYLAFNHGMGKLVKKYTGESLRVAAADLIARFVGSGLNQTVLETIRTQAWGVGAPTP